MRMRTDRHNNPAAITVAVAEQAGLILHEDYEIGDPFKVGGITYYTARLRGNQPYLKIIQVIDSIGFYTKTGRPRWSYVSDLVAFMWDRLSPEAKVDVVGLMYKHEGGIEMIAMFPNYGRR